MVRRDPADPADSAERIVLAQAELRSYRAPVGRRRKKRKKRKGRHTPTAAPTTAAALVGLARRSPSDAGDALQRARRGEGPLRLGVSELDDLTVLVTGELRAAHRFESAHALLETLAVRSRRAELEAGLLAFARGEDEQVRAIVQRTPELVPVLEPLVAVVDGRDLARTKRGATPALKSLYAAARAVRAAANGDPKAALRAAASAAEPLRSTMRAACRLGAGGGTWDEIYRLAALTPELRRLALMAGARSGHADAVLAGAEERDVAHAALAALATDMDADELCEEALFGGFEELFDRPGDVALRAGFARLRAGDPSEAVDAFERAIVLGSDPGESLRGAWLARRIVREPWRAFERAATAYAHLLADDPRHAAARVAVVLDLAMARVQRRVELPEAMRDVEAVRASLGESWLATRGLEASVDRAQARVLGAMGDPEAARRFSERALARDRTHPYSWEVTIELAPPEERARLTAEALEATGDASRFAPARLTAGAVANALAQAAGGTLEDDLALIAREAGGLSGAERSLLDAGLLYILVQRHDDGAERFVEARLHEAPELGRDLAITALSLAMVKPVREWLPRAPVGAEVLEDVILTAAAYDRSTGQAFLGLVAPALTRRQLDRLKARVTSNAAAFAGEELAEEVFNRAHDALHPELCLEAYRDGELGFEEDLLLDGLGPDGFDALLGQTLAMLGVSQRELAAIPPARKRKFFDVSLAQMERGTGSPAELTAALVALLGYDPSRRAGPRRPKKPKKRKKGRR